MLREVVPDVRNDHAKNPRRWINLGLTEHEAVSQVDRNVGPLGVLFAIAGLLDTLDQLRNGVGLFRFHENNVTRMSPFEVRQFPVLADIGWDRSFWRYSSRAANFDHG